MPLDPTFKFNLNQVEAKLAEKVSDEMADIASMLLAGNSKDADERFDQMLDYVEKYEQNKGFFDWLMS